VWHKKYALSNLEVARILEDFLEGRGSPYAWDDFTQGMTLEDEKLESIRLKCSNLSQEYPPVQPTEYCNEEGRAVIRHYIQELRS
jgi:hypothetical protein